MFLRLLYAGSILLLISGCNIHQYLSFSSELPSSNSGAFIEKNDSISITYTFQGNNTIKVELENKTDRLYMVDWSRSSMIFNGQSLSFTNGLSKIEGTGTSNQYIAGTASATFDGTISETSAKSYIPPHSSISRVFTEVPIAFHKNLRKTYSFETIPIPSTSKKFTFDQSNSLHNIRSYLVVGIADKSGFKEIQHSFWMTDLVETGEGKLNIKGNQLRVSKQTSTGTVLNSVGTALILAAAEEE